MSSSIKHKQQAATLDLLNSSPDTLISALMVSLESTNGIKLSTTSSGSQAESSSHNETTVSQQQQDQDIGNGSKYKIKVTSNEIATPPTKITLDSNDVTTVTSQNNQSENVDHSQRKRKSKTGTCTGTKRKLHSKEYKKSNKKNKDDVEDTNSEDDDHDSVIFVRKLIDIMLHPKTIYHQNAVLAVLRANETIRKLFIREKATLGKQMVPILRESSSKQGANRDSGQHDKEPYKHSAANCHNDLTLKQDGSVQLSPTPETEVKNSKQNENDIAKINSNSNGENVTLEEANVNGRFQYLPLDCGASMRHTVQLHQDSPLSQSGLSSTSYPSSTSAGVADDDQYQAISREMFYHNNVPFDDGVNKQPLVVEDL